MKKSRGGGNTTSVETNKVVVRRFYEVVNKRDPALVDEFIAQDYVDHLRQFRGLDRYKQHLHTFFKSFPDAHEAIEDIIAEGDRVCVRLNGTATNQGDYRGLAPTGKKISWAANTIFRLADGKIAEMWAFSDELKFSMQLGLIEYTDQVKKLARGESELHADAVKPQTSLDNSTLRRLMNEEARNVVLQTARLTEDDRELAKQHNAIFLEKYTISLDYDGESIVYPVYIVPHEFWGASWTKGYIEVDNDFPKFMVKPLGLHEACERYVCDKYGLYEHKEGHGVASEVERRWFLKHLGEEKWYQYGVMYDEIHRKEWNYVRGLME